MSDGSPDPSKEMLKMRTAGKSQADGIGVSAGGDGESVMHDLAATEGSVSAGDGDRDDVADDAVTRVIAVFTEENREQAQTYDALLEGVVRVDQSKRRFIGATDD